MPNYPFRFKKGQGLELSGAEKTQAGYLRLENAVADQRDVISKRTGAPSVARTTTADPDNEIPVEDLQAVFHRQDELVLQTNREILSRRECAGDGQVVVGTATPGEIDQATELLDDIQKQTYEVTIPLAGSALTPGAYTRLDRQVQSMVFKAYETAIGNPISATLAFDGATLVFRWFGPGVTTDEFQFPAGAANPRHFQQSITTGTLYVPVPTAAANRCRVAVYQVVATEVPRRMVVSLLYFHDNVLGDPEVSCSDGSVDNPLVLQADGSPSGVSLRIGDTDVRSVDPAIATYLLSNNAGYMFDATDSVGGRPRFAAAPTDTISAVVAYARYPEPDSSPADTSELFLSGVLYQAGAKVGISYDATDDVIGFDLPTFTSRYTHNRASGSYDFDDVETGDLSFRYDGGSTIQLTRLIAGSQLSTSILSPVAPENAKFQVISLTTGHHLVLIQMGAVLGSLAYPTLGPTSPTPRPDEFAISYGSATDGNVLAYVRAGVQHTIVYTFDVVSFSTVVIALPDAVQGDTSPVAIWAADLGGGDARFNVAQFFGDPAQALFNTLYSYGYSTVDALQQFVRQDPLSLVTPTVTAIVQLGTYPRSLWALQDGVSQQVYEIDDGFFVRVEPAVIALPGGNWTPRGPWTRGRLRVQQAQDWGTQTVRYATATAVTSPATGDPCILELVDVALGENAGVQVIIYSTHAESGGTQSPVLLDGTGVSPHVVHCADTTSAFAFVTANSEVLYQFWQPGEAFAVNDSLLRTHSNMAPIYDMCGGTLSSGLDYYGIILRNDSNKVEVQCRDSNGTVLAQFEDNMTDDPIPVAVSIYAFLDEFETRPTFMIMFVGLVAGGYRVKVRTFFTFAGGAITFWQREFDGGAVGEVVRACTVGGDTPAVTENTGIASLEVQNQVDFEWEVRSYEVSDVLDSLIRTDRRSAIYGSYVERANQLLHFQTSIETSQDPTRRNGIYAVSPRTGEVIIRADFGSVEDLVTRASRFQVSDSNLYGDHLLVLGWANVTGAVPGQLTGTKYLTWDNATRPNRPAVTQGVAISSHGGFPRGYDSSSVFEQDWHELPKIVSTLAIGGGLAAGEYGVAITYDWYDASGVLYRAAPFFSTITLGAPGAIIIEATPLQRTERAGVIVVVWRTLVNGASYRRVSEQPAQGTTNLTFSLTQVDTAIDQNEVLDQVPGVLLPAGVARVTDWISFTDDRLWGRDPERDSLVPFTVFAVEGRAPHWPTGQALSIPTALPATGVVQLDGRVVLFSTSDVAYTATGGPDDAGNGAYATPSSIPSSTGAWSFETLAKTPDGYLYGTTRTPYLLSRGMQTMEFSDQVYKPYELDGERAEVAVWRPDRQDLVVSNGPTGRMFRFNRSTQRWVEDTGRASLDISLSGRQEFVSLLIDGRVLVERNDTSIYTDGGIAYPVLVGTPWFHVPRQDGLIHSTMNINTVMIWGTWEGDHTPKIRLYTNYSATASIIKTVPAARTALNQVDGKPYLYSATVQAGPVYSARIEVLDASEPNATFRISGIDIEYEAPGSGPTSLNFEHQFE